MKPKKSDIVNLNREDISKKFNVSLKTAIRWQKEHDLYESKIVRLDEDSVLNIRQGFEKGDSVKDLANKYNVSLSSIYRIINNETHHFNQTLARISVNYNPN